MKNTLFAATALSTLLSVGAAAATQDLTGLHFGLGFVTNFDEYEAELDTLDTMSTGSSIASWTTTESLQNVPFDQANNADNVRQLMNTIMGTQATAGGPTNFAADVQVGNVNGVFTNAASTVTARAADAYTAYLAKSRKTKRRSTNCGGEVKLAYFHSFANHLMIGIDFGCTFNSKSKKSIKFAAAKTPDNPITGYKLEAPANTPIATLNTAKTAATIDPAFTAANAQIAANSPYVIITQFTYANQNAYLEAAKEANADYRDLGAPSATEVENYLHAGDKTELTFEKDIFSPRLAFVIGGTINGWFAGVRTGVSYMTGKLRGTDGTRKVDKSVSISSPFIGVQVMKQMAVFGRNDAHMYLTADWNIGDGHRAVNVKNVKSYKQNNVNIALGVTWRWKLGA